LRRLSINVTLAAVTLLVWGCDAQIRKSDAELGLNPQQASGRRVFDQRCAMCHEAYSSRALRGPTLQGMFRKQFMPSGTPANDERVREVISLGRSKMPAFGNLLSPRQMDDLLVYLHTL